MSIERRKKKRIKKINKTKQNRTVSKDICLCGIPVGEERGNVVEEIFK